MPPPKNPVPVTIPHEYNRVGEFLVRARGMGNCDGDVFTEVNVSRVRGSIFDRRPTNRFAEWDLNGDGVITRAEWRGTAEAFDVAPRSPSPSMPRSSPTTTLARC